MASQIRFLQLASKEAEQEAFTSCGDWSLQSIENISRVRDSSARNQVYELYSFDGKTLTFGVELSRTKRMKTSVTNRFESCQVRARGPV